MIEIKPSKNIYIKNIILALIVSTILYFSSSNIMFLSITFILLIIITISNLKTKILLNNGQLIYFNIFGHKSINILKIDSIKLRSGGKSGISFMFFDSENNPIIRIHNISIYKKGDILSLIKEITKNNPSIKLSNQVKNFIEGKFYWVTTFKDA